MTVPVDDRDAAGRTALMLAVLSRHADAVDALIAHGADVNAADANGKRPLEVARSYGSLRIIDALLRAGAR